MTIKDLILYSENKCNINDAELIIKELLNYSTYEFKMNINSVVSSEVEKKCKKMISQLEIGKPIQYVIGNVNFCGYKVYVDERVLIPRFETETLVDKTIFYAKKMFDKKMNIVDLGTGSACIAIALKKSLDCEVDALDISLDALELAQENAKLNKVNITFIHQSMDKELSKKYDIIISNPPYISYNGYVEEIVKNNEPNLALFAQDNGLYFYKKILEKNISNLNKPGLIAFELGDNQKELLEEYIKGNYPQVKYSFENDLTNRIRYLFIFNE